MGGGVGGTDATIVQAVNGGIPPMVGTVRVNALPENASREPEPAAGGEMVSACVPVGWGSCGRPVDETAQPMESKLADSAARRSTVSDRRDQEKNDVQR